jgi:hypothetical protein
MREILPHRPPRCFGPKEILPFVVLRIWILSNDLMGLSRRLQGQTMRQSALEALNSDISCMPHRISQGQPSSIISTLHMIGPWFVSITRINTSCFVGGEEVPGGPPYLIVITLLPCFSSEFVLEVDCSHESSTSLLKADPGSNTTRTLISLPSSPDPGSLIRPFSCLVPLEDTNTPQFMPRRLVSCTGSFPSFCTMPS